MRIENINGTSQNACSCGSWLDHWGKFSGESAGYCPVVNCYNKDLVGAHVQKAGAADRNWYIVPLCNIHNKSSERLLVSNIYKFVPANKSETCEKILYIDTKAKYAWHFKLQ